MSEVSDQVPDSNPLGVAGDVVRGRAAGQDDTVIPDGFVPGEQVWKPFLDGPGSYRVLGYKCLDDQDIKAVGGPDDGSATEAGDDGKKQLEGQKASVTTANDYLSKLLTLNTALVGGGLVLAKGDVMTLWWAASTMSLLLVSLGFTLWGLLPKFTIITDGGLFGQYDRTRSYGELLFRKKWTIVVATAAFVVALFIGVIGVFVRAASSPPQYIPAAK
jgi:hypothetical protein